MIISGIVRQIYEYFAHFRPDGFKMESRPENSKSALSSHPWQI